MGKEPSQTLLSSTARWTASARALESKRPDRLFYDPFAEALAGDEGASWLAQRTEVKVLPIVLRTRFFDDFLQRINQENTIHQVVFLAAGMDTRAFRLPWPENTSLFELDQAAVMQEKNETLAAFGAQARCRRAVIAQDLTEPWQEGLQEAGFQPEQPSLWLLEGFLFYLPNEAIWRILEDVTRLAAPGSWLGFDIVNAITLTHPLVKSWIEMQAASGAPWIGTIEDPVHELARLGWRATLTQAGQPDAHFGRWPFPIIPIDRPDMPHNWFVTAQRALD
jgi:methyltransferase (TIGR00027 family)